MAQIPPAAGIGLGLAGVALAGGAYAASRMGGAGTQGKVITPALGEDDDPPKSSDDEKINNLWRAILSWYLTQSNRLRQFSQTFQGEQLPEPSGTANDAGLFFSSLALLFGVADLFNNSPTVHEQLQTGQGLAGSGARISFGAGTIANVAANWGSASLVPAAGAPMALQILSYGLTTWAGWDILSSNSGDVFQPDHEQDLLERVGAASQFTGGGMMLVGSIAAIGLLILAPALVIPLAVATLAVGIGIILAGGGWIMENHKAIENLFYPQPVESPKPKADPWEEYWKRQSSAIASQVSQNAKFQEYQQQMDEWYEEQFLQKLQGASGSSNVRYVGPGSPGPHMSLEQKAAASQFQQQQKEQQDMKLELDFINKKQQPSAPTSKPALKPSTQPSPSIEQKVADAQHKQQLQEQKDNAAEMTFINKNKPNNPAPTSKPKSSNKSGGGGKLNNIPD
jgi:hypothetical protein